MVNASGAAPGEAIVSFSDPPEGQLWLRFWFSGPQFPAAATTRIPLSVARLTAAIASSYSRSSWGCRLANEMTMMRTFSLALGGKLVSPSL